MATEYSDGSEEYKSMRRHHKRRVAFISATAVLACFGITLATANVLEAHESVVGTAANGLPYPPDPPYTGPPAQIAETPLPDDFYAEVARSRTPAISIAGQLLRHTNQADTKATYSAKAHTIHIRAYEPNRSARRATGIDLVFKVGDVSTLTAKTAPVTTTDLEQALAGPGIDVMSAGAWDDGDWIRITNSDGRVVVASDELGQEGKIIDDPRRIRAYAYQFNAIGQAATNELVG